MGKGCTGSMPSQSEPFDAKGPVKELRRNLLPHMEEEDRVEAEEILSRLLRANQHLQEYIERQPWFRKSREGEKDAEKAK